MRRSLLLPMIGLLLAINLAAMPGMFWIGDPFAWREETRSLLFEGHLWIDAGFAKTVGEPGQYFVHNAADDRWYSKYGIVNALMAVPPMLAERLATGTVAPPAVPPDLTIYNLYNVLLAVLVGAALYALTGRYSRRPATRVLFVLAALYGTYLWYYLRAQSSEVYQVLFFLGYFACLVNYLDSLAAPTATPARARWAAGAWACVALLVFTRVVYVVLIPLSFAAIVVALLRLSEAQRTRALRRDAVLLALPPLAIVALLALLQHTKFGAPLLTGYHAWRAQEHLFTGDLGPNLWALLFEPRYSLLLYFPPLALAAIAARRFHAKYPVDARVIGVFLVAWLVLFAKLPTWHDDWGYGVRYLLFLLPVASLPFLCMLDRIAEDWARPRARLAAAGVAAVLGYSAFLNFEVNRLDFFALQHVRPAPVLMRESIAGYFSGHAAAISHDLIAHRRDLEQLAYMRELRKLAADASVDEYKAHVAALIDRGNWYWK